MRRLAAAGEAGLPRLRLPAGRQGLRHAGRPRWLAGTAVAAASLLLLLGLQLMRRTPVPPPAPAHLLDRLRQQGLAGGTGVTPSQQQQQLSGEAVRRAYGSDSPDAAGAFAGWLPAAQVQAAEAYVRQVLQQPQPRRAVPASEYVIPPEPHDMRAQHAKVAAYLASPQFHAKVAARRAAGMRGIIINAGGPALLSSAIVTLKVLREVHNCSLPVELVWHSSDEMEPRTLAALQARWAPLTGVDLSATPWPAHQRPLPPRGQPRWRHARFVGKVASLAASRFASALLLDADNLPLSNPEGLWSDLAFNSSGSLFWPDYWAPGTDEAQQVVYDAVGLKHEVAAPLLAAGKGRLARRGTESGQLLLDLVRHADVAEWALWANSFGDVVHKALWGDKDTYALAFGAAGKAHTFSQAQVPPGAALTWREAALLHKASGAQLPGWALAGMLAFDASGAPAFLHRTMNKFAIGGTPWPLGLLTGPLPARWIAYYLSQESQGPMVGVPVTYAAPASAFTIWHIPQPLSVAGVVSGVAAGGGRRWDVRREEQGCPVATFTTYRRLREHGLPVGASDTLDAACWPVLAALLRASDGVAGAAGSDAAAAAAAFEAAGLRRRPELLAAARSDWDEVAAVRRDPNPLVPPEPLPDAMPVLAWAADYAAPAVPTHVSDALAGSYAAFSWLQQHVDEFPLLAAAVRNVSAASGRTAASGAYRARAVR